MAIEHRFDGHCGQFMGMFLDHVKSALVKRQYNYSPGRFLQALIYHPLGPGQDDSPKDNQNSHGREDKSILLCQSIRPDIASIM